MGELQLRAFCKQFGLSGIVCRIFTAYGERENESHAVIALIAKAAARLDPFPIWGDGLQTRNFTYVQDTVTGMALAWRRPRRFRRGERRHGNSPYNPGPIGRNLPRCRLAAEGHRKAAQQTGGSEKPGRRHHASAANSWVGCLLTPFARAWSTPALGISTPLGGAIRKRLIAY